MEFKLIQRIALLAATAACSASFGQVFEGGVSGGIHRINGKDLGSGYSLDDGWRLRFHITLNTWNFFGQEFGYGYNRTKLLLDEGNGEENVGGMAIHQGYYNLLAYATPEGSRFRPFATGGVHFSNFVPPGASATQGQGENKIGINYGAGVKVKVSTRYLIRFELRQYINGKPFKDLRDIPGNSIGGTFRQTEASVGIAWCL